VLTGAALPEVVISCHRPPAAFRPFPLLLVSTVAPPIVVVFRLPAVAAAGLLVLVLPLPPLAEDVPDELHAASTAAAAATAGTASSIRRRFGAPSRVSDLIIAFSFAPVPARAPAPGGTLPFFICQSIRPVPVGESGGGCGVIGPRDNHSVLGAAVARYSRGDSSVTRALFQNERR
jgi:hypothetical protein